jgi:hypothetical protein
LTPTTDEFFGKSLGVAFHLLNQRPGLDAAEVRQILIELHLALANDQDPLLDGGSCNYLL